MDSLRFIDYLLSVIGGMLTIGWVVLFYSLRRNADGVKETAALMLSQKEKLAALVLSEKEKLAALVKTEHDKLSEQFTQFRIKVAEDYATSKMVRDVLNPMIEKLNEIEKLLHTKLDRREFEQHRDQTTRHGQ